MPFSIRIPVRFAHCDPASIVFYARYFEMFSSCVEDWFSDGLHASFPKLLYDAHVVVPTAHFTVDFDKPSEFGDVLTFDLHVIKISRTSCEIGINVSHEDEQRVRVRQVLVFTDQTSHRPIPIPEPIRTAMNAFLSP